MRLVIFQLLACATSFRLDAPHFAARASRRWTVTAVVPATPQTTRASRRSFLGKCTLGIGLAAGLPDRALAAYVPLDVQLDREGRNPVLTNRALEKVRMLLQDEADIRADELASPDAGPPEVPARLLAPIVLLTTKLKKIDATIRQVGPDSDPAAAEAAWRAAEAELSASPFTKKRFKRIFNMYSDNIWYESNSDRANAYLGGGAPPSSRQTEQYLFRNDALTNIEEAAGELGYILEQCETARKKQPTGVSLAAIDTSDLWGLMLSAVKATDKYLALAPPADLAAARQLIADGVITEASFTATPL